MYYYLNALAQQMTMTYAEQLHHYQIESLLPIPLSPARQRWRGYNQAAILAKKIGLLTGIPANQSLLKRRSFQKSQTTKNKSQRQFNNNPFIATATNFTRICLVDDVCTTGSTLTAAAQAIWQHNPQAKIWAAVWGLTISGEVQNQTEN